MGVLSLETMCRFSRFIFSFPYYFLSYHSTSIPRPFYTDQFHHESRQYDSLPFRIVLKSCLFRF